MLPMLRITKSFFFLCYGIGLSLFLLHLSATPSFAALLHLNGNWSTPFGDDDGPWNLGQSYNLSVSHDPTAAISVSGNIRYATAEQQSADKTTTLVPSVSIGLSNDLFRFNLSGSQSKRQKGNDPSSIDRSWNSNLSSNFKNPLWPQLRLSYGESNSTNDATPVTVDNDSSSFAAGLDYSWDFIKLLYNYRNSVSSDKINNSDNRTIGHSTNIQLTKNLVNNRLSLSASHQYSLNNSEASTSRIGGQLIIDLIASAAYAGIDNTPLSGTLPTVPALNDQNLQTATSAELPGTGDRLNIALQINLQTFSILEFYFDRSLPTTIQQRLHWSFYSSQDNVTWLPVAAIPAMDYREENSRTIATATFPTSLTNVRYIKMVIETDPGFDTAFFTEIRSREVITGTADTVTNKYTSENIQGSINYRPWEPLQFGYSFNRNISDSDRSALSTQDNHTISSHLNLNRYFMLSLSLSESSDEIEGLENSRYHSFACSYQATPLDSTSFSLNVTRSEHYNGNEKDRSSDSISTNLATVIVPDLTANLSYQWSRGLNHIDDTETRSNSYTFNLMARLNTRLNLSYGYSHNETDTHNISLLYHPSELLSFTTSAMQADKQQSYSASMHLRVTRKIQTNLRYAMSRNDERDLYSSHFNLSWNISSHLSVRQSIEWSESDSDSQWSGLISASYNF